MPAGNLSEAGPTLIKELERFRVEYVNSLEAIHHQQLVIAELESLLRERLAPRALLKDAACQTEVGERGDGPRSVFYEVVMLRIKLDRIVARRQVASIAQEQQLNRHRAALERLRATVAAQVPKDISSDVARLLNVPPESIQRVNSVNPSQSAEVAPLERQNSIKTNPLSSTPSLALGATAATSSPTPIVN